MARKYENGYLPKIEYWQYKLNKAVEALDTESVTYAAGKLAYFTKRQAEVYSNEADEVLKSIGFFQENKKII